MGARRHTEPVKSLVSIYGELALLGFIIIEFVILEFVLGVPNSPLFSWDESVHGIEAWKYYTAFRDHSIREIIEVSNYYPPLVGMITGALFLTFGVSDLVARMTNVVFYFLMIFSIFIALRRISRNNYGTVIAITMISASPLIIGHCRMYMLDFPLTAAVSTLLAYFIIMRENITKKAFWALFGVIVGITILVKWTGAVFALSIFLAALISQYVRNKWNIRKTLKHGLVWGTIVALSAIAVSGWWYIPKVVFVLRHVDYAATKLRTYLGLSDVVGTTCVCLGAEGLYFKLFKDLIKGIGPLGALLLLGSAFLYLSIKDLRKEHLNEILIAALISCLIFALIPNKQARYLMPVYPFLVIFASAVLSEALQKLKLIDRRVKFSLVLLVVLGGSIQMSIESTILSESNANHEWRTCIFNAIEAVENISKDYGSINVLVLPDKRYFNGVLLEFYSLQLGVNNVTFHNGVYVYFDTVSAGEEFNITKFNAVLTLEPINFSKSSGTYANIERNLYRTFYETLVDMSCT